MTDHPVQHASRIKSLHPIFADACCEAYERFLDTQGLISELGNNDDADPNELIRLERAELVAGVQVIVMSAMCFEAAIYDYAARQLGDRYVREHLDRLDLLAKWVIIPRLVCGRELRKDRAPFAMFKQVVGERNRLLHWKSEKLRWGDAAQAERLSKESGRLEDTVHKALRAIVSMSFEMEELLGAQFNPLPSFDRDRTFPWEYSARIEAVIEECKRLVQETPA